MSRWPVYLIRCLCFKPLPISFSLFLTVSHTDHDRSLSLPSCLLMKVKILPKTRLRLLLLSSWQNVRSDFAANLLQPATDSCTFQLFEIFLTFLQQIAPPGVCSKLIVNSLNTAYLRLLFSLVGSGDGLVSRVVASDSRGLWFESSHRKKFICNIYLQLYRKDKNK